MEINKETQMMHKTVVIVCGLAVISSLAFADDSFESIAGFRLGQECSGSKFTKKQSESDVRNPDDSLDKIEVSRNQHESIATGGHSLYVSCSIIDNRIHHISLTSKNTDGISNVIASLHEKMGRAPDDKDSNSSKPQRLLGITMDGHKMESENWNLSGNRKATAYTIITQPFGATSLSDLKWQGGIELSYSGTNDSEWKHLKQRGITSSKEKKASDEKQQKDSIKGLLNRTFAEWGTEKATIEAAADLKNGTPKLYISGTIAVFAQGITPEERKRLAHLPQAGGGIGCVIVDGPLRKAQLEYSKIYNRYVADHYKE
jgi:hypothetical protein